MLSTAQTWEASPWSCRSVYARGSVSWDAGVGSMLFSWDAPCCPSPGASSSQAQTVRFSVDGSSGASLSCLLPSARVKWGTSIPSGGEGGLWGTEEQAQQPPKPSDSYAGHEQSCLQGGAEINGVQIQDHFLLSKGVIFSISPPLYSLNHLYHTFVGYFNPFGEGGLKLPIPAGTGLWAAGAAWPVCCRGVGSTEHRLSLQTAPCRQTRCTLAWVPFPVLNTLHQGLSSKQIHPLLLQPDSSKSLGNS